MGYIRLTREERYQIVPLLQRGESYREIGEALGRSASTISREVQRNGGVVYVPDLANRLARERRQDIHPPYKISGHLTEKVIGFLNLQWSPEQIAGRLKLSGVQITHETIYQFVFRDFRQGGQLYFNLRRKRKRRRSRQATRNLKNVGKRTNQMWIDKRPDIVEKRERLGDFERDTVLGKAKGPVLLTIVDRVALLTKIAKLEKLNAMLTHRSTVDLLRNLTVHTLTNDNGPEFAEHKMTAQFLKANIYFSDPYASWQRGTNENTNGLIRQYFPKGTDFTQVSDAEIKRVETLLNNRPRKSLGYRTPLEVKKIYKEGSRNTDRKLLTQRLVASAKHRVSSGGVALRTRI